MPELALYQVDAFARRVFEGNPAAVVPLEDLLPDDLMQSIAAENNLAETAFFIRSGDEYKLRWFTPLTEVDLCGHATLASAFVIFEFLEPERDSVVFDTCSGRLAVERRGALLAMDFPSRPPERVEPCPGLIEALGGSPAEVWASRDYMVVYRSEDEARALRPDFHRLAEAVEDDVGTLAGQGLGDAKADAAGGAGDEGGLAREHGVLQFLYDGVSFPRPIIKDRRHRLPAISSS